MSVLRGVQRFVSAIQKRRRQFTLSGVQQMGQAYEESARPTGVLQFHQIQSAIQYQSSQ